MQQILLQKYPVVELHFLAPIATVELPEEDKDRRKLTLHIEQLIKEKLNF
jgi:1-acyl-sn-glycerol-3-phosphate acyltransferase